MGKFVPGTFLINALDSAPTADLSRRRSVCRRDLDRGCVIASIVRDRVRRRILLGRPRGGSGVTSRRTGRSRAASRRRLRCLLDELGGRVGDVALGPEEESGEHGDDEQTDEDDDGRDGRRADRVWQQLRYGWGGWLDGALGDEWSYQRRSC